MIKLMIKKTYYWLKIKYKLNNIYKSDSSISFNENLKFTLTHKHINSISDNIIKKYVCLPQIVNSVIFKNCIFKELVQINAYCKLDNTLFNEFSIIGENTTINNSIISEYCKIGAKNYISNCEISRFTYTSKNVSITNTKIGSFCSIAQNVLIGGGKHPTNYLSSNPVFYSPHKQCGVSFTTKETFREMEEVKIGNDVWIGANAIISNGITIADGAIIGAGAVVVKDVKPYEIVGGVPAKFIKYRFDNKTIEQILKLKWWNWDLNILKENLSYFQEPYSNKLIFK
jgi:acetyltransferase-like isoleucine patch superfamily enzyme